MRWPTAAAASPTRSSAWRTPDWSSAPDSAEDGRGVVCAMTDEGYHLLERMAPTHVNGVRDYLVDLATSEDFAALGRVMNAVVRQARRHPPRERDPLSDRPPGHDGRVPASEEVLSSPAAPAHPLRRAVLVALALRCSAGACSPSSPDPRTPAVRRRALRLRRSATSSESSPTARPVVIPPPPWVRYPTHSRVDGSATARPGGSPSSSATPG